MSKMQKYLYFEAPSKKAFFMSKMQKYLYFEAPSKKFLLLISGKFLFFYDTIDFTIV
jgi:hypothetical protein